MITAIRQFFERYILEETLEEATAEHGLQLETTYTGKCLSALIDHVQSLRLPRGPVLYWNTYNSIDHSKDAQEVDYRELPPEFHQFFQGEALAI